MSNWGTMAIGCRIGERADPLFVRSFGRLLAFGIRKGDVLLDPAIEMPHHFAANLLVKMFLESQAESLCMIDSDMIFEADTVTKLRDNSDGTSYGMLSGLCVTRRRPYAPLVLRYEGNELKSRNDLIDGKIVDVDIPIMAFALIRREVFDKIEARYVCNGWYFDWGPEGYGEDATFGDRARSCGVKLGVDTGVSIGHRGMMTYGWDTQEKRVSFSDFHQIERMQNK